MSADEDEMGAVNKRERSPSFPYLDLTTAVELLGKLYSAAKMNDVRVADVSAAWDMAPKSGSLMRYIAALGQYGLIETIGSGGHRRVKISSDGRRILEDTRPGVREQLCSEAALKPKIVRGLYFGEDNMPQWGKDRPNDNIAESSLKFDLHFGAEAARRFLTIYDSTIQYIVDSEAATNEVVKPHEEALESKGETEPSEGEPMRRQHEPVKPVPAAGLVGGELNAINFRSDGNGVVTISATLNSEGLELLEKKIAAFKMLIN